MKDNSTQSSRSRKSASDKPPRPKKPYPDFPLYAHPLGYWSKKIKGKIRHFGRWGRVVNGKMTSLPQDASCQQALLLFKATVDDHHAGRKPRVKLVNGALVQADVGLTVRDLCNRFLTVKTLMVESGEMSARMLAEYNATTDLLMEAFGRDRLVEDLASDDFEALRATMAKRWGPVRLGNEIGRVRTVFKYCYETGLIKQPVRFGPMFKKPSASVMRRHRAQIGGKMLEAVEVQRLLNAAPAQLKAMILLGVNCGFGNHDVATLPLTALDLDKGWIEFARPKTGIARRCPLWPETVQALRTAIAERTTPRQDGADKLVFITARGRQWLSGGIAHPVAAAVGALLRNAGIHRAGIGFYSLRHVFRTIADGARDPVAINLMMGHGDGTMGAVYRERIDDSRLQTVAEHVRVWLFPPKPAEAPTDKPEKPKRQRKARTSNTQPVESSDAQPTLRLFSPAPEMKTEGGAA